MTKPQKHGFIDLRGIKLICVVLLLTNARAFGETRPILSWGDHIWFATKSGLYRYNKAQDEWDAFSSRNGLAGDDVRDIGIEGGIIWVATDRGVSNSDLRFSDWRSYTTADSLPNDDVNCIAFSRDYVWIGTDKGAARFDKLLEEWESYTTADGLAGDQVNDIVVDGNLVWFATSGGISKLDADFDKWTTYTLSAGLPSLNVKHSLISGEYLWFVTDEGLVRYDKRLMSWRTYTTADGIVSYLVNRITTEGDNIWLATANGVNRYDPVSDSWFEGVIYHKELPSKDVADLAIDGSVIWFCHRNGISSYNSEIGSWRHYTSSDGLLDNFGQGIFVSGLQVFVVTEKGINILDKKTQDWQTYEFPQKGVGKAHGVSGLRVDEQGLGFDLSRESQIRLSGLSSLEFADTSELRPIRRDDYGRDAKNDIRLRGTITGNRSIAGFYNDVREDDIKYGLAYRGGDTDLLQEAIGGEFSLKPRNSEIIEDMNLTGVGVRLRKGLDGAGLVVEPRYGKQRGYFETDFFTYKIGVNTYQLSHTNIIPETEVVIADREILRRGIDYLVIYSTGWLMFPQEELIEDGAKIDVRYQYELIEEAENDLPAFMTTGISIGDNYYAGLDALHKDDLDVISLNAEGKDIDIGQVSMKLRPEIAYSRQPSRDGMGTKAEVSANAPKTLLKLNYEGYSENFQSAGKRETMFGELERHIGISSHFDIAQYLPITLRWERERSRNNSIITSEENIKINATLSKASYPAISLTGKRDQVSNTLSEQGTENAGRIDLQYDLPAPLLSLIRFRRAGLNSYYRESHLSREGSPEQRINKGKAIARTCFMKLGLYPLERFDLSSSYKLSRKMEKGDQEDYKLQDEFRRLLIRSNFASIKGLMSNLYLDDIRSNIRSEEGHLVRDKDRRASVSMSLIPGIWARPLEPLTLIGRYSLIQQTVPMEGDQRAESNSRALQVQTNLRPHSAISLTGTYERSKSWLKDVKNNYRYRAETELKPGSRSRIVLEYTQEQNDENTVLRKNSYSPSLWWETRWSGSWTTRWRFPYQKYKIIENGKTTEKGSTLMPSLSFRYINRELPYKGRLYVNQILSMSFDRTERTTGDLASETYSTSLSIDWKITGNLSCRLRLSLSYKDKHTKEEVDSALANVYVRMSARF